MSENLPAKFELFVLANNMAVMVNDERKALGLRELHVVPYLQECAEIRAEEASEYYSHTRPDGTDFSKVIDYDKISYGYCAENLANTTTTVYETFQQWRNSEKHWAAITNANITHMGIGVFYDPDSEYGWYWCQIFTNDLKGETEHEGQYIPERIDLNNKISVLVTDENGNPIEDANIKISEFSSSPDTLQNIKVGKNGGISTEKTFTSSSSNRTMLVKSTAEPVIFYDLETGNTYTLIAEKSGYKYVSGMAGFYFNSNGKIIDSFFGNNYDGNFVITMRLTTVLVLGAFENAEKLRKIVIPESVKKIGARSFLGTDLKSIKIASDCEYSESSFPEGCKIEFYSD